MIAIDLLDGACFVIKSDFTVVALVIFTDALTPLATHPLAVG